MYFRDELKETNINDEFENDDLISKILRLIKKYKLYIFIGILITLIIIAILFFTNRKVTNYLIINGEQNITLYQGSDYIEPGYQAYNSKEEDLTNKVIINSTLDTSKIGEYEIRYTLGEISEIRKITIVEKPKEYTYIYLTPINNNINIYLKVGETYKEPGYQVFSSTGKDLTSEIKVTGTVDTNKEGSYELIYTVKDSNGVTISASRTVIVMKSEINLSLNPSTPTNKDVIINITIIDNYFDYLILPDNTKVTEKTYSYKVNENGKYTFKVYDKEEKFEEKTIEVKNIDKTPPSGSCSGSYGNGKSTITITASDQSGIQKYILNGNSYTTNKITINSELTNANITIYDKAGNTKTISCKLNKNETTTQSDALSVSKITNDGVIVTVNATSKNADIAGYYFSYTSSKPQKTTSKFIETSNKKIDVVRLPGTTYVWVEDKNGNISNYKTINISNDALLITTGSNYKVLNGTKLSDYLKNNGWSIEELNKLIARSVRAAGIGSKTGAATAAVALQTVLAQKYAIKLPYENGGIYRNFGASSKWGITGIDCSAFVTWTYYNSGYNDLYIQPAYWAGWKTYDFSKENGEIGDFLVIGKTQGNRHVKLIIGKTNDGFITAESSGSYDGTVIKIHPYSSSGGYRIQKGDNFNYYYEAIDKDLYPTGF